MMSDVEQTVEWLRVESCNSCVFQRHAVCQDISNNCMTRIAADLIESLSAELEQVKLERDGLNILLGQAQSMLETRTRERDAAVEDMQKTPITLCNACAHYHTEFPCAGGKCSNKIHLTIVCSMFEWRGVKEEV